NLVGIDHVGFGPDTLYGDHVGLHNHFASQLSIKHLQGSADFPRVEYVAGIENPTEAFPNIVRWLVAHGYSDADIAKAGGGSALRVVGAVWWRCRGAALGRLAGGAGRTPPRGPPEPARALPAGARRIPGVC